MKRIFEQDTVHNDEQVGILKDIMFVGKINNISIYGKTGTGNNGHGWFVGFTEEDVIDYYFAVYLDDSNHDNVTGQRAKEITEGVITSLYD